MNVNIQLIPTLGFLLLVVLGGYVVYLVSLILIKGKLPPLRVLNPYAFLKFKLLQLWHAYNMREALHGDAESQFQVAWNYAKGIGVAEDRVEAFKWYRKSAENGYVVGIHNLGYCYEHAFGCKRNLENALKCFLYAGEKGCLLSIASAGYYYQNGLGCKKKWLRRF